MIEIALSLLAQAQDPPQQPSIATSLRDMLPFLVLLGIAFYFIILRPQKRAENEKKQIMSSMVKGDKVQTIGGIQGTVYSVDQNDNTVTVEVDKNCKIKFLRTAVSSVDKKGKKGAAGTKDEKK